MNQIYEMEYDVFQYELARVFELDLERDLFDIQEDIFDILQNKEIIEFNENKQIELCKIRIEDEKTIECYFITLVNDLENKEENRFIIFDNYKEAKNYFDDYVTVKSMEDWKNSTATYFDDFCKVGDKVSEDIIWYFRGILPPVTYKPDLLQAGEPYSHAIDKRDDKFKPTYTTFEKKGNFWIYKGNCFKEAEQNQEETEDEESIL